jgi:hypothetical protein
VIAQAVPGVRFNATEHRAHLGVFKVFHGLMGRFLVRNGTDLLAARHGLGDLPGDVAEQAVNGRQARVARTGGVAPCAL